jgi:hypothetical protein
MVTQARPLAEITTEALKVLYKEIGIVNTVRFVNQYTAGYGDYSQERRQLFADMTLDSIVSEIKRKRRPSRPVRKEAKSRRLHKSRSAERATATPPFRPSGRT